jgi:predicted nucleotide-binding protein
MATRKRTTPAEPEGPWHLRTPRAQARAQLEARVALGGELRDRVIQSGDQLKAAEGDYRTWSEYNAALLEKLFTDDRAKHEYTWWGVATFRERAFHEKVQEFRDDVETKIRRLASVIDRLELAEEPEQLVAGRQPVPIDGSKVFVVHGHDNALKEAVARFLEKLGLGAVILHEQPNRGKTLIEKFEAHGDGVAFAVVLLTPDDVSGVAASNEQHPRPRQNVVFELGYFFGRLGRERVAAIVLSSSVERPADVDGLVYIDGSNDSWKLLLARELQAAGLPVDMNKAI